MTHSGPNPDVRLRFAPSPTGQLHIGGARTALFNWAYARRLGGAFLLRIEDTDRERSTKEFEHAILDGLRWLGLDWDEGPDVGGDFGPYRQTERFERYAGVARRLQADGAAYPCFCAPERLDELRERQRAAGETPAYDRRCRGIDPAEARLRVEQGESHVLRFAVPEGATRVPDMVCGDVTFQNSEVDDWVMVRASGSPTYNFVVVCDDTDMRITHVLRGEEHLTNTPKQILLYEALGLEPPVFAHVPLMLGTDKKKLSKRTGDTALQDYREKGYPPEAVVNFLALQSWALDDKTTILSTDELIRHFDPRDIRKGGSIFDPEKFRWMAGEYLRSDDLGHLAERCAPFVIAAGQMTADEIEERRDWFEAALESERERVQLYSEIPERLAYLFVSDDEVVYEDKALKNARKHDKAGAVLTAYADWLRPRLADALGSADGREELRQSTRAWVQEQGVKFPVLFQPLRCSLTGAAGGADLFDSMALLGADATLARIAHGIRRLAAS